MLLATLPAASANCYLCHMLIPIDCSQSSSGKTHEMRSSGGYATFHTQQMSMQSA
jgi:hypothetical protein